MIIDEAKTIADSFSQTLIEKYLKEKQIILTGATGLIGGYLLAVLAHFSQRYGCKILAISKYPPPPWLTSVFSCRIRHLKQDLSRNWTIPVKADYIIHAAGYGQPSKFLHDPYGTLMINGPTLYKLMLSLNDLGRIVNLSSSEVYNGLTPPFREDQIGTTTPQDARSGYIEAKRMGESLMHYLPQMLKIQGKILTGCSARVSLIYGPGTQKNDGRVLNQFVQQAVTTGKIIMKDQGLAERTYGYVADAAHWILDLLLFGKQEVYNVGGISKVTIKGLANRIGCLTDAAVECPEHNQSVIGAPAGVEMDLTKFQTELGYRKFTSLEEGLRKTIAWQKQWLY